MSTDSPRFAMVAGEASGDLLAGLLLGGLKTRWPGLQSHGIGGPRMAAQGFEAWWPHSKLAVRGYLEVLLRLRELLGIRKSLGDRLLRERPDAFIGIDAPDFNLGLETRLKAQGIKSIHFVSPSVWAWRGERILKIGAAVDHMLCLFPFEPAMYAKHGIAATYVGHPLADAIPLEVPRAPARAALGLAPDDTVVALLPGSRRSEVKYIAPRLLAAATLMKRRRPGLKFVFPVVPGLRDMVEPLVRSEAADTGVMLLDGQSHEALAACDVTLIGSGTATLEAALFKRPMVITYNMNWLEWHRLRRLQYQPWVGLPNILSNDFVVPELLQDAGHPEALANAAFDWLDDPARCAQVVARFDALHRQLRCNTAQAATDAIEKVLRA
ncbi:lipid-A-disaccharide synthase [Rhizobacter sp. Root1221]|uniref:lipid-A-disaccharide synthase n=1 Tax=Rhizobacter sp. Root1221 TaxID=1736433 RepID=UPI0009E8323F|nr:lipid-A-disaccharide synthase [Rhizobacter sp. Root1221]